MAALGLFAGLAAAFPVSALDLGNAAPEIGLPGTDGRVVRLADHRGEVILVDFWASWCGPCRESFPFLATLAERYRERGLFIVGVSVDTREDDFRAFLADHRVGFGVVRDAGHEVARRYAPPSMPTSYLIDRAGRVRHVERGFRHARAAELERRVVELLDEAAP